LMPLSVLVRRTLHAEAVRAGLTLDPAEEARRALEAQAKAALAPPKPIIERRQVPTAPNALRDEITQRIDSGERALDVAESYGMPIETVKAMYKRGKENQTAAREFAELRVDIGTNLVYDPVDPDNPTEEEQATNAEIARQKLVDMGLL